jgi:hypothetical protein
MKAKDNREINDQSIVIEDLSAQIAEPIIGGNRVSHSNSNVYFTNDYSLTI